MEVSMKAFNVVRFRPKPGQEEEFERRFKELDREFDGLIKFSLVKGENGTYFSVGEWKDFASVVGAKEQMVANLDHFRNTLIDNGEGKGGTDPVSGTVIHEDLGPSGR